MLLKHFIKKCYIDKHVFKKEWHNLFLQNNNNYYSFKQLIKFGLSFKKDQVKFAPKYLRIFESYSLVQSLPVRNTPKLV